MGCLFCNIAEKNVPADIVFENETIIAFNDINPQAPIHQLIIPKKHIATINALTAEDTLLMGQLYLTAKQLAEEQCFAETGYRVVMNCNEDGGQEIYHIHLHLLAKRQMTWPPG